MKSKSFKTFSTMLLGLIISTTLLQAQIIYTNVDPDQAFNTNAAAYLLDLNHDGTNDFSFVISMVTQPFGQNTVTIYPHNGSEYADASFISQSYPFVFHLNNEIASGLSWESNQYTIVSAAKPAGAWVISGICNDCIYYLGLRLRIGDLTYYGWAQMKFVADPSDASFVIYDYACNNLPFQSILAGEVFCTTPAVTVTSNSPLSFCNGSSVSLTAATASYNLQWKKDGTNIPGATTLNFSATESGIYTIDAGNSCGNATSNESVVTVNKKPKADIAPSGMVSICAENPVALIANTGNNLIYQWKKNGVEISGATNSALAVNTAGKYKVVVTKTTTGCSKTSKVTTVNISCKLNNGEVRSSELAVSPNPINGSAVIMFHLATDENVVLRIYDLTGRVVRTIADERMSAGTHELVWDSQDDSNGALGHEMTTGIYLLQLQTANENETIRLSVVR